MDGKLENQESWWSDSVLAPRPGRGGELHSIWRPQFKQSEFALLHGFVLLRPLVPVHMRGPAVLLRAATQTLSSPGAPHRHPLK